MDKQKIMPQKKQTRQKHLSRLYFLSKGCKQVPPDGVGEKILWAHPDEGYFMSAYGNKIELRHSPAHRRRNVKGRGFSHPILRHFGSKIAHRLMFETFADEPCPIYFDSKGNPYKGIVHHVIENPYDVRMDNLIGWLSYKQHKIADKRRRELEAVLPDMYCLETKYLKTLQDPRETNDYIFNTIVSQLRSTYGKNSL
jgi:hypothetical protein